MARSRFLWKLYGAYVLLILLTVSFVEILVSRTIEQDSMAEIQQSLLARAQLLRGALSLLPDSSQVGDEDLQTLVRALGEQIRTRLTVIGADGIVRADSEEDPSVMDNHGSRPEVFQAQSHGQGQATRFSRTLDTSMMYVAIPTHDHDTITGYVRTAISLSSVRARLARLRRIIITGALLAALIALPMGYWAARRITAPLGAMTQLARDISRGEFDRRIRTGRKDEIGQLATALNSMAAQSQQRIETVARDRNRLVTVFAGMVEGVIAVDSDERITLMNVVAGEFLDADPEGSIGKPIRAVTRASKIPDVLSQALSRGEPVTAEVMIVGTRHDCVMEAYASPLSDLGRSTTGAVVVLHDISDLRRLESVRRDFVANVSHELKTPITAAQGLVETMLSDDTMDNATRHGFLERIRAQVSRLGALVGDLLTLSRLEAGATARIETVWDFRQPITEKVAEFEPVLSSKELIVNLDLPSSPVPIAAEKDALGQIIGNLFDNAIKYTEAKGQITISLKSSQEKALLEVTDTGIGIEPMHQERIFERFYCVDKARSRDLGGTGLGLAIVKHLVRGLGGVISVSSTLGGGSTFRVELLSAEKNELSGEPN